ncbi:hydrogenase maturation protease [Candidatus Solincola sp.]|jgi:hydrogenase maturation protease|nr:HyaD/HybD family hydrogenase maturation endopeptidase [Actinomycetota bacterium]
MSHFVVIGIGNLLHGDDGLGIYAVRRLRERLSGEVELVEGGVLGLDLLPYLEGKEKAIFIDAVDAGDEPGAVFRFSPGQVPRAGTSPPVSLHDLGLYELVGAAQLLEQCPREIIIIAVQVKSLDLGSGLSPEVEAALPVVCRLVEEEVKEG